MKEKDLRAVMEDAATNLYMAMTMYGFIKEHLYPYMSLVPCEDVLKLDAMNYKMNQIITALEGFELSIKYTEDLLRSAAAYNRDGVK